MNEKCFPKLEKTILPKKSSKTKAQNPPSNPWKLYVSLGYRITEVRGSFAFDPFPETTAIAVDRYCGDKRYLHFSLAILICQC